MRKIFMILLPVLLVFALASCGDSSQESSEAENSQTADAVSTPAETEPAETTSTEIQPEEAQPTETTTTETTPVETAPAQESNQQEEGETMQISIEANGSNIIFELNDSQAASDLYQQLPLSIEVENFSNNEKIFYPSETLDTTRALLAEGGAGTLAYYAPWGDVVMFYGSFNTNGSLFELGEAVSGAEQIEDLSGTIIISAVE